MYRSRMDSRCLCWTNFPESLGSKLNIRNPYPSDTILHLEFILKLQRVPIPRLILAKGGQGPLILFPGYAPGQGGFHMTAFAYFLSLGLLGARSTHFFHGNQVRAIWHPCCLNFVRCLQLGHEADALKKVSRPGLSCWSTMCLRITSFGDMSSILIEFKLQFLKYTWIIFHPSQSQSIVGYYQLFTNIKCRKNSQFQNSSNKS